MRRGDPFTHPDHRFIHSNLRALDIASLVGLRVPDYLPGSICWCSGHPLMACTVDPTPRVST